MEAEKERPNILIEIQNEKMDVDESENEDGEIIDDEPIPVDNLPKTDSTVFTTGINIFDQEEQRKLQERAKRFALRPEEIHSFTDADLEELRESLGITEENENIVRFDTVHLRGTKDMLIEDILDYFAKYAPTDIEWVDEESCNIKWLENVTAARAMFYSSKPVAGMPVREPVLVKDFLETEEHDTEGQSILLKNRKVELQVDELIMLNNKNKFKNAVDISEITIPIPPGYWRMGDKHPKAKSLLLRFAFKTDKKPYKTENLGKYYKKLGAPKPSIDKRREGGGIFDRNKDLPKGKNPWGNLARNWDEDAKFRETIPSAGDTIEVKNTALATRLGLKEQSESDGEIQIIEEETTVRKPKGRSMRMRMYADEEEERLKMRKAIQKLKTQSEHLIKEPNDLRTILSINNYTEPIEPIEVIDLVHDDLGKKLKNRSRQMVFSINRKSANGDNRSTNDRKENIITDVRSMLNKRRIRSPHSERHSERSHRNRHRSSRTRQESPVRRRSPLHRRRSSERTVRCKRYSRYQEPDYSEDDADDNPRTGKPKSKVAVVIKTQKRPTVASTIWSKVQESDSEESSSDSEEDSSKSDSEDSSSSSEESETESESDSGSSSSEEPPRRIRRPGFDYTAVRNPRNQLKITMRNDKYRS